MIDALEIAERLSRRFGPEAGRELASVLEAYYQDLLENAFQAEFRQVREALRELAEAQQRTEQRVEALAEAQHRTEQRVEALAEAQQRTEQRLEALTGRVEALAEAQQRTEQRLEALTARVDTLTARVDALAEAQRRTQEGLAALTEQMRQLVVIVTRHEDRLGRLHGLVLESSFRDKASAYLGRVMRGTRVISAGDLADDLEGILTSEEWDDLIRADVIVKGRAMIGGTRQDVFAVVEVSVTPDESDVERAARRAALLRKKGWKSLAVVAGEVVANPLIQNAALMGVAVMQDGRQFNWSEALAAA